MEVCLARLRGRLLRRTSALARAGSVEVRAGSGLTETLGWPWREGELDGGEETRDSYSSGEAATQGEARTRREEGPEKNCSRTNGSR